MHPTLRTSSPGRLECPEDEDRAFTSVPAFLASLCGVSRGSKVGRVDEAASVANPGSGRKRHLLRIAAAVALSSAIAWPLDAQSPAGAQTSTQDHATAYTEADIAVGARLYTAQCAQCHGANGDLVSGIDLRRGQLRRASTDDDLAAVITNGVPTSGMPPFALQPFEITGIVAFIRSGLDAASASVAIGDAGRGLAVFDGKGACTTCHRVNGRGSRVAPDLSDIGALRTPASLARSLLDPSSAMMPINRPIRIVMNDGSKINGRRLNEDTFTVQLIDDQERLWSIAKSDMRTYVVDTMSTMPSYASSLTDDERADVIAYLLTLKGTPP
jgi:cytochrome c oxidase cbb3-type subunit III